MILANLRALNLASSLLVSPIQTILPFLKIRQHDLPGRRRVTTSVNFLPLVCSTNLYPEWQIFSRLTGHPSSTVHTTFLKKIASFQMVYTVNCYDCFVDFVRDFWGCTLDLLRSHVVPTAASLQNRKRHNEI